MAALLCAPAAQAARPQQRPVTTIAIVAEAGINPLHEQFRTRDGRDPVYPAGMPAPVRVPLPRAGTWEEAIEELRQGPLGSPQPGRLYALSGTRLVFSVPAGTELDLGDPHGTGSASSAAGLRTGTSPDSVIVVLAGYNDASYGWLAQQRWIDVASTSVYVIRTTEEVCGGAQGVRELHRQGGLLFGSAGNTYDAYTPMSIPNGLPEVFQVGGVDRTGRTWLPPRPEEPEPFFAAGNVVRPYETGARYSFPAAASESFDGTQPFGGTSGATPTVAGYAAELIAEARKILAAKGTRTDTALARRGSGARLPAKGPLADGTFTRDELVDVLHATATPAEVGPHRYLLEGYGATDARSHARALDVLRGRSDLPARPDEDARHAQAESVRAELTSRC